jgi:hypothetical protein
MAGKLARKFSKSKGKALWRPAGAKQLRITCQIIQNGGLRAQPLSTLTLTKV